MGLWNHRTWQRNFEVWCLNPMFKSIKVTNKKCYHNPAESWNISSQHYLRKRPKEDCRYYFVTHLGFFKLVKLTSSVTSYALLCFHSYVQKVTWCKKTWLWDPQRSSAKLHRRTKKVVFIPSALNNHNWVTTSWVTHLQTDSFSS